MTDGLAQIKAKLERKATFQQGIKELQERVTSTQCGNQSEANALWPLVQRCHTLLKSRYSNPQFWKAGLRLFQSYGAVLPAGDSQREGLDRFIHDAIGFCEPDADPNQQPDAVDSTLSFDMLRATGIEDAEPSQRSDAGLVFPASTEQQTNRREELQRLHEELITGLQAVYEGMEQVTRGTEASIREIDNVLEVFRNQAQPSAPPRPPASKQLLSSLPRFKLNQQELDKLGRDQPCPVCTDILTVGDEVVVLPCKHVYHPVCLQPWLKKDNSCPTCRQELRTDDHEYEAKKEKQKEEEEDRRGAANAVSHNEFMYI